MSGSSGGLRMTLNLQQYEGIPPLYHDEFSSGMKINVHDARDPQITMTQKGKLIPTGMETVASIQHERVLYVNWIYR